MPYSYDTVVQAIEGLRARGFTLDFNVEFENINCADKNICLNPAEFEITEMYRFEGNSNPDDEDVVYAVVSKDNQFRGIITSAFGTYADALSTEMIRKLTMHIQ